jgi:hypothetical protein
MTQTIEPRFVVSIEQNTMILCEKHAKTFELAAMTAATPHTIIELEDEDAIGIKCHACNLQDELTRPKLIMPGEF